MGTHNTIYTEVFESNDQKGNTNPFENNLIIGCVALQLKVEVKTMEGESLRH